MILARILELVLNIFRCTRGRRFKDERVIELPLGLILKISEPRGAREADIIRFVQRNTSIPTPRIIASDNLDGNHYLLMKKVKGVHLGRTWGTLNATQRARIAEQLRSFVAQLRILRSPHGRTICSLNGAPLRDSRITSTGAVGPFVNEEAFNERLLETTATFDQRVTLPGAPIRSRLRTDHDIVFTHGDIAPRNIMVDGDTILALIDWEQAGWYPDHWEFVKAVWFIPNPKPEADLWIDTVKQLFDKDYEDEWEVENDLRRPLVGPF